jgi:hypothetical protein
MNIIKNILLFLSILAVLPASAQIEVPQFGSGSSVFDGWVNMNRTAFRGISGGFPGSASWNGTAGSNQAGSGDADLAKLSGSAFFSDESLYFGSWEQIPNAFGGTLRVRDQTPLSGVRTIVLQIQIGEAEGYDFQDPTGWPVLKLNGSDSSIAPNHTTLLDQYLEGFYDSPETGEEPLYINTYAFEWNLSSNSTNSIFIDFSAVNHARIYSMRLDQSTAVLTQSIFDSAPAAPPTLRLVSIGTPTFNGSSTSVVHGFQGDANANFSIQYKEALENPSWVTVGNISTGNGTFNVTFSASGDRRTDWSQKMFFRATRQ